MPSLGGQPRGGGHLCEGKMRWQMRHTPSKHIACNTNLAYEHMRSGVSELTSGVDNWRREECNCDGEDYNKWPKESENCLDAN